MNIEFEIECGATAPGDVVAVVGQEPELGAWDEKKGVKLDGTDFPLWRGQVQLPSRAPGSSVEYKYVILLKNGSARWEALDGNRVRLTDAGEICRWRDGRFGERAPLVETQSPAVQDGPKADSASPSASTSAPKTDSASQSANTSSPKTDSASPSATTSDELRLVVEVADTSPGDCVAVAGSWDWAAPPRKLDGSGFPLWTGCVPLKPGQVLEYKYLVLKKDGETCWEVLEGNRSLKSSNSTSSEQNDGKPNFPNMTSSKQKHGKANETVTNQGYGNSNGIIKDANSTIYGRVCLDYGTLEQRMAKRMDQPVVFDKDRDEQEHSHARTAPRTELEADWAVLERAVSSRAAAWPAQDDPHSMPPPTSVEEDSKAELKEIVAFEGRGAVTLCERFQLAQKLLERAPEGSAAPWTVLVWLRFSAARQLTWQRKSNTRPFLLSQAAEALSQLLAQRLAGAKGERRQLWRLLLVTVPRGGSGDQGQAIRDDILTIMGRWELKKRKGDFMEQWHQKLHNNTTPDDVHICEAYLLFLRSNGDLGQFYSHLEAHGIDRERLQTFERPILQEPIFFASIKNGLTNDLEKYLVVLKNVHSGADLEKSVDEAANGMNAGLRGILEAILAERGAGGNDRLVALLGAVAEARARATGANDRSRFYLDLALESHSRLLAERLSSGLALRGSALCTALLLEGLCRSVGGPELRAAFRDLAGGLGSGEGDYEALRAAAAAERARGAIAAAGDVFAALQPRAEALGAALRAVTPEKLPEPWAVTLFAEECTRGGAGFAASLVLTSYERRLREVLGGSPWQLVSVTPPQLGTLHVLPCMKGDLVIDAPSIILAEKLSGEEDPPEGTVAVLTPNAVDVLSHVAVRARTMGIFLATCFDEDVLAALRQLQGQPIRVAAKAGAVVFEQVVKDQLESQVGTPGVAKAAVVVVKPPPSSEVWVPEELLGTCPQAGAKSKNLSALRAALPKWILQPKSAVVPCGVLGRVFASPENVSAQSEHAALASQLDGVQPPEQLLQQLRRIIQGLKPPAALYSTLRAAVEAHGAAAGDSAWWTALTAVWASSWSDRAFQACSRSGIQTTDVAMAVLVQQLVPAEYSFVIHTVHPTGDPGDLYAEVVVGLGEVLVGNYAGRALSFSAPRDGSSPPKIVTLPSKGIALKGKGLIFRSDSNAEDLENFAGAGLFDSVAVQQQVEQILEYRGEKLVEDRAFQQTLLDGIAKLAMAVETAAGGKPQDIEGCYAAGQFYVVQTRPQA
ncbi:unnamed protein product [Polarella glacialis]|uniref:CBM20 domain-containing protein n=1 Tax=Polarella glacialis TaxID=89957 RepID=A0A813GN95_POLGL|nr:unnamed protein product [Polarella glacialis]